MMQLSLAGYELSCITPIDSHVFLEGFFSADPYTQTEAARMRRSFMTRVLSGQAANTKGNGLEQSKEPAAAEVGPILPVTSVQWVEADGIRIFYRSAGDQSSPVVLLLHGFPTSSFMFRNLIPFLADQYRVIAPDLPGFGFTEVPDGRKYIYTFEALARTIEAFTDVLGINRYAMYIFDYGAPTGLRLAMAHPERVTAIVSQNGNAYEEGLGDAWGPIRQYWAEPTDSNREVLRRNILTFEGTRWQYTHGVEYPETIAPESYTLDTALLKRPGNEEIQLDLFLDYASNVKLYPKFQQYFRTAKPPLLAIWGRNDPFFIPAGAEAYRRDLPNAQIQFLDTGHFAIETHAADIAGEMKAFLRANGVYAPLERVASR
jgi:pimeloyl-ACP methyl ester carboxylesterase